MRENGSQSKDVHNSSIKKAVYCRKGCGRQLQFDKNVRSASGKLVPLNLDGSKHECPLDPYNAKEKRQAAASIEDSDLNLILMARQYIDKVNGQLDENKLELVVSNKSALTENQSSPSDPTLDGWEILNGDL